MNTSQLKRKDVDDYIASQPADRRERLQKIRQTIQSICPEAKEGISYGMPAYKLAGKPLVYFAGFTHHIGLYATPTAHGAFSKELAGYKQGKGSVQFPLDQALPLALLEKIIRFKRDEIMQR